MDAIFCVRRMMEMSREKKKTLQLMFVDLAKAYDSVDREKLWKALRDFGVPIGMVKRIRMLHLDTRVKVRLEGRCGGTILIVKGARQGCVLAPLLFNIYYDAMLKTMERGKGVAVEVVEGKQLVRPNAYREKAKRVMKVRDDEFADDMVVIAESGKEMQKEMDGLQDATDEWKLRVSVPKTMHMVGGGEKKDAEVRIGEVKVRKVKDFVYLGSMVQEDGSCEKEVMRRIGIAMSAFRALLNVLWRRKEVTVKTKIRIFNAFVMSRLMYGAELWNVSAREEKRLEAFHTWCLRRILRVSWMEKVRNEEIRRRCGQSTLESQLRKRRLRWLGHVQRMGEERLPKAMLWGRLAEGKRPKGGGKKRWVDVVMKDLRVVGLVDTWKEVCRQRKEWEKRISVVEFRTSSEKKKSERAEEKKREEGGRERIPWTSRRKKKKKEEEDKKEEQQEEEMEKYRSVWTTRRRRREGGRTQDKTEEEEKKNSTTRSARSHRCPVRSSR